MTRLQQFAEDVRLAYKIREEDFYGRNRKYSPIYREVIRMSIRYRIATRGEVAKLFFFQPEAVNYYYQLPESCHSEYVESLTEPYQEESYAAKHVDPILERIFATMGVGKEDIMRRDRRSDLVKARQICWYLLSTEFHWSLCRIGKYFNRDHTSILHGINGYNKNFTLQELMKIHYNHWVHDDEPVKKSENAEPEPVAPQIVIDDLHERWLSPERRQKERNARLMANVDYAQHEYSLPRGV